MPTSIITRHILVQLQDLQVRKVASEHEHPVDLREHTAHHDLTNNGAAFRKQQLPFQSEITHTTPQGHPTGICRHSIFFFFAVSPGYNNK